MAHDANLYVNYFERWLVGSPNEDGETRAYCPLHEDPETSKSPSASINFVDLIHHCQSCGKGYPLKKLHEMVEGSDNVVDIKTKKNVEPTKPLPTTAQISRWTKALLSSAPHMRYLRNKRGLAKRTIVKHKIGWDGERFTIPIYGEDHELVNVRRYLPNSAKESGKMISWSKGHGVGRIYGLETLEANDEVLLTEGELDRLIALQHGFPAVTHTSGASVFKPEWARYFKGKEVYCAYDDDDKGDAGAAKVAKELKDVAAGVYRVQLDMGYNGGDITDHFVEYEKDDEDLWAAIEDAEPLIADTKPHVVPDSGLKVSIEESQNAQYRGMPIEINAMVAGKNAPAYVVPKTIVGKCGQEAGTVCAFCPIGKLDGERTVTLNPDDDRILNFIGTPISQRTEHARVNILGAKCKKFVTVDWPEEYNVEELIIAPSIGNDDETHMRRHIFNVGSYSTPVNRPVKIVGQQRPDHRSSKGIIHSWRSRQVDTDIERFSLDSNMIEQLKAFQAEPYQDPLDKCLEIAEDLSTNITQIYGRELMHVAYDLVFHSLITFPFLDEVVTKGWLECLVMGDTRTGKSEAASKLIGHYRVGTIRSCESVTLAGLVGGAQKVNDQQWMITWGVIPLNDKRLVVLDEMSGLYAGMNGTRVSKDILENMSSIRSEGRAEVTKIEGGQASARTRLIWITNPLDSRMLSSMPGAGLSSITGMIQNPEDIARFDYALAVADEEVDSRIINSAQHEEVAHEYVSDMCHDLVLWAWSRSSDQVRWANNAEQVVLDYAQEVGERYIPDPPLVQHANIRFKIARLAVAIAARTFSASKSGELLIVHPKHVRAAVRFMDMVYGSKPLGYLQHSNKIKRDQERAKEFVVETRQFLVNNANILRALDSVGSESFLPRDFEHWGSLDRDLASSAMDYLHERKMIRRAHKGRIHMQPALVKILEELDSDGTNG